MYNPQPLCFVLSRRYKDVELLEIHRKQNTYIHKMIDVRTFPHSVSIIPTILPGPFNTPAFADSCTFSKSALFQQPVSNVLACCAVDGFRRYVMICPEVRSESDAEDGMKMIKNHIGDARQLSVGGRGSCRWAKDGNFRKRPHFSSCLNRHFHQAIVDNQIMAEQFSRIDGILSDVRWCGECKCLNGIFCDGIRHWITSLRLRGEMRCHPGLRLSCG